ncbi:MAG: UvrD-helicase domain-containing protein [Dehalococcoidia bacterium]|nr:MAG: UvrD-helicase domain-containing protein [Dehalococcoidia bacterium]
MDILTTLNSAQREAAETISGPLLILAGPGSGKTRVITHRIAYLIRVCGISPRRIMAVTFTNKAAREMEERLKKLTSGFVRELTIGTFHAICVRILRQDGGLIGINPRFVIYDREDQLSLVKTAIKEAGFDPKQYAPSVIISVISNAKSQVISTQAFIKKGSSHFEEVVGRVYEKYQRLLEQNNALDFDDLLMKTVQLFDEQPEVLDRYRKKYQHIMVDEFQDTNLVQYKLVKQLAGGYRNICVVGDPDQSIYSWRSADLRNILSFEKDYPEAKIVLLEQNYRSTKAILETASSIISANQDRKPTKLWTENEQGELITVVETYTQQEEAQYVVSEIERLLERDEVKLAEFAVMYRTNAQSRALEEAFIRYGTPYKLVAGTRFYERREVKDVIAYLRFIHNQQDSISLLRIINIPQRGIGERTLSQLKNWANSLRVSLYQALQLMANTEGDKKPPFNHRIIKVLSGFYEIIEELVAGNQKMSLVGLFDLLIKKTGYKEYLLSMIDGEERWENVLELRTVARQYDNLAPFEGLATFLEGVTLVSDVDSYDESVGAVTLITLHQAKGLEFPVVFIVGLEEGILPHIKSFDDPAQMEEERRLCYVGVTRAKKRVYLLHAFRRNLMGSSTTNSPSRFLDDIPPQLVAGGYSGLGEESQIRDKSAFWESDIPVVSMDIPELKVGDRVLHSQFGKGMVVSYHQLEGDGEVVVAFPGVGVKKLLLSFARLEKVD